MLPVRIVVVPHPSGRIKKKEAVLGLSVLRRANVGKRQTVIDAETTPLRDPENYQYDVDVAAIAELWRRGSVIGSWLLD